MPRQLGITIPRRDLETLSASQLGCPLRTGSGFCGRRRLDFVTDPYLGDVTARLPIVEALTWSVIAYYLVYRNVREQGFGLCLRDRESSIPWYNCHSDDLDSGHLEPFGAAWEAFRNALDTGVSTV